MSAFFSATGSASGRNRAPSPSSFSGGGAGEGGFRAAPPTASGTAIAAITARLSSLGGGRGAGGGSPSPAVPSAGSLPGFSTASGSPFSERGAAGDGEFVFCFLDNVVVVVFVGYSGGGLRVVTRNPFTSVSPPLRLHLPHRFLMSPIHTSTNSVPAILRPDASSGYPYNTGAFFITSAMGNPTSPRRFMRMVEDFHLDRVSHGRHTLTVPYLSSHSSRFLGGVVNMDTLDLLPFSSGLLYADGSHRVGSLRWWEESDLRTILITLIVALGTFFSGEEVTQDSW